MRSSSLIFFGTENFSTFALSGLIKAKWDIECVVTKPDKQVGRGKKIRENLVKQMAQKYKIPVIEFADTDKFENEIANLHSNLAVLSSFGKIISENTINKFSKGIINIHPSLLPKYRGPSPIESVILNGDKKTGVSIMKITNKMDAGPIYAQETIELKKDETKPALYEILAKKGTELLLKSLPLINNGQIKPKEQNHDKATYTTLIHKRDGKINWNRSCIDIERQIRAYLGWPGSYTKINNVDVIITKAYAVPSKEPGVKAGEITIVPQINVLSINTSDGSVWVQRIKPFGRNEMTSAEFIRGYLK